MYHCEGIKTTIEKKCDLHERNQPKSSLALQNLSGIYKVLFYRTIGSE